MRPDPELKEAMLCLTKRLCTRPPHQSPALLEAAEVTLGRLEERLRLGTEGYLLCTVSIRSSDAACKRENKAGEAMHCATEDGMGTLPSPCHLLCPAVSPKSALQQRPAAGGAGLFQDVHRIQVFWRLKQQLHTQTPP